MAYDGATFEIDPLTLTTPRARLEYLRDFIRRLPAERFDMADWRCGSVACIGGWCETLFTGDAYVMPSRQVGDLIGLRLGQYLELFYPPGPDDEDEWSPYDATSTGAADVLDHLLNTGEVDWSMARKVEA